MTDEETQKLQSMLDQFHALWNNFLVNVMKLGFDQPFIARALLTQLRVMFTSDEGFRQVIDIELAEPLDPKNIKDVKTPN